MNNNSNNISSNILGQAKKLLPQIIQWRRYIHQNAELSFEENLTQEKICTVLEQNNITYEKIAKTGILAKLKGAHSNRPIVLRADMDALPINEQTGLEYACTKGVMHACGHDIHSASLLGALVLLKEIGHDNEVWGLFQPGEELHPGGASMVIAEGVFNNVEPIFIGQHCSPELKTGTIGIRAGQFMASTDEIHITVNGRGGHGALPHKSVDAVLASCAMIMAMQQISSRNADPFTPTVLSFGKVIADGATNILPDSVLIEGTFRTMNNAWRDEALTLIESIAVSATAAHGCTAEVNIKRGYPSVINNPELTAKVQQIASNMMGDEGTVQAIPMRMTAEDFGFYAERYPACFVRLGVGNGNDNEPALHTSKFNPNEESLAYGAAFLASVATNL